jgi:hypothetical protein
MNNAQLHQHISDAILAHLTWVRKADHLISGLPVKEGSIPLDPDTCEFGQWLKIDALRLKKIEHLKDIIEIIEHHHHDLHAAYAIIYEIYFYIPKHRSTLNKLFSFQFDDITQEDKEEANIYFKDLKRSSEYLVSSMHILKEQIKDLNYSDLLELK